VTEVQRLIDGLRINGWSVMAISRAVGVSDATIRRWVNGTAEPGNETAVLALLGSLEGQRAPKRPYQRKG
jgi:transposase